MAANTKTKYLKLGRKTVSEGESPSSEILIEKGKVTLERYKKRRMQANKKKDIVTSNNMYHPIKDVDLQDNEKGAQMVDAQDDKVLECNKSTTLDEEDTQGSVNFVDTDVTTEGSAKFPQKVRFDYLQTSCSVPVFGTSMPSNGVARSHSFHEGTTEANISQDMDDDVIFSSHIKQKLMRSNTLLTKLTSLVDELGDKIERLEDEYVALEMKYQCALDQLKDVEGELHSCTIKLQNMECNIATKETKVASIQKLLEEAEQKLVDKGNQVTELQEEIKCLNSLADSHTEKLFDDGNRNPQSQNPHEGSEIGSMNQQVAQLVLNKEKHNHLLMTSSLLKESLSLKDHHLNKLQLELYEILKENEIYATKMETIIRELGKIEAHLDAVFKRNKNISFRTDRSNVGADEGDLRKTQFVCKNFAWKNAKNIQVLLARESKAYFKKKNEVKVVEEEVHQCQSKLEQRLADNQCLQMWLSERKKNLHGSAELEL